MLKSYLSLRTAGTCTLAFAGLLAFTACDKDGDADDRAVDVQEFITDENEDGDTDLASYDDATAAEVEDHTSGLGIELESAREVDFLLPDGSTKPMVVVGDDITLSPEQYATELADGLAGRQYSTNSLVRTPQTIRVLGYTGGSNALTSTARTALGWAVNNYNRINTGLTFTLEFGTANYQSYDIVVYRNPDNPNNGGQAEFPSGGKPGQYIQLWRGAENNNTNTQEHLITHEMGHAMGLRHTDYFNRRCDGTNEGSGGVGANLIPGTPSGIDANSVMISCFTQNGEDGEFGFYDVVALEYLY